jgi:hypothetical protein
MAFGVSPICGETVISNDVSFLPIRSRIIQAFTAEPAAILARRQELSRRVVALYEDVRFARHPIVFVDAKNYGKKDDQRQHAIQAAIPQLLTRAAARSELDRASWGIQPGGDSELAVLPSTEPEPRVVDDFVRELKAALTRHNHDLSEGARLRLRMAIHHGVAVPADSGFAGQGVVVVSRLADCAPLRNALTRSGADLAVILSARVFEDVVLQRYTSLSATEFRHVRVRQKEFGGDAWLLVPGHDVHAIDLSGNDEPEVASGEQRDGSTPKPAAGGVVNTFHGSVDARGSVIGIRNG